MTHTINGIQILPDTNIWNGAITSLPLHASSAAYITAMGGASTKLRAKVSTLAFSSPNGWGIPYNIVNNATPTFMPVIAFPSSSFAGPYPIPASPLIEEPSAGGSDHHLLCLNTDTGILYELLGAVWNGANWTAICGWNWDMSSNALPASGSTAADSASMPILPGLLLYDEVAAGTITHALRCAIPTGSHTFIWPAKHSDGSTGNGMPPHGSRFRLKASLDISGFSATNQIILRALKVFGCFLVDQGTTAELKLFGMGDNRWNDSDLAVLNTNITAANFEVVDASALTITASSGQKAAITAFSSFSAHG